jgi:hypothetical protein
MNLRPPGLAVLFAFGLATASIAQAPHMSGGSVLIFPHFDSRPASATVISVTNTSTDRSRCANGFRRGDVRIHYIYYGQSPGRACREFDRIESLTPGDTLTVLANEHNLEGEMGFLTVAATDPVTGDLIQFDELIGDAYVANASLDIMWSYVPYPFRGLGIGSGDVDGCGRVVIGSGGTLCFDGIDYDAFPGALYVSSFFEERAGVFENRLSLMSTSGQDYINEVSFLFYNNEEDVFSRTFKFVCHTSVPLSEISGVARNLNGDPTEFLVETGWASIEGRRVLSLSGNPVSLPKDDIPALLGVFVQIVRSDFTAGHALHVDYDTTILTQLPN